MRGVWLEAGKTYGAIELISAHYADPARKKGKIWDCRCTKCGNRFQATGQQVLILADGCRECTPTPGQQKRRAAAESYIGHVFGQLEVIGYAGLKPSGKKRIAVMECKCLACGSITEIPLNRLKRGGAQICKYCNHAHLGSGWKLVEEASAGGSCVLGCAPDRALNKNSTTGVKGVSYMKRYGAYRAYINFRRKQYHLGTYKSLEDAAAARKAAEQRIHGGFLRWYAEAYPEEWAKLCKVSPSLLKALDEQTEEKGI